MRKPLPRPAKLLIATLATAALLLGMATPAQAYSPEAKEPACVPNFEPKHFTLKDCTVQKVYRDTKAKIETAMWSDDSALRAGTLNYLVTNIIGNGILSFKKSDPARKPDVDLLNTLLSNMSSAPTPEVVACYGNVALNYIAKADVNNQRVRNMYAVANAIKELKGKYGEAKGKVIVVNKILRAFGDVPEMKKIIKELIKDKAKDKLKEEIKKALGIEDLPLDRFTFYMTIIQKTQAPVERLSTDAQFKAQFDPLTDCETGLITYPTGPKPKPKPHYVTKVYSKTFGAKALLTGHDALGQGSGANFKMVHYIKGVGGCFIVKNVLNCEGYNKAYMDKQPDSGSALRISINTKVPSSILKSAYQGKVYMQATASFPKVKGSVKWQYGPYGSPSVSTLKRAGSQTLATVPLDTDHQWSLGDVYAPLDISVPYYNKVSIDSVQVRFIYKVKQG